ncbi:MAG TPA: PAS domain S-box protein [Longimicrobium sp.]|uniref:PAS domain S-box protein n=1 Tax=Longimicrobium sp. TaxID=2029185 RepID=UPI002ED8145A
MSNPSDPHQAEVMSSRLAALRDQAEGSVSKALLRTSLAELECAIEELRVTEEDLRQHQSLLADAWQAAERSSEWYREMFDGAADALLATDIRGTIRDVNRAGGVLMGVRPDLLRGKPVALFVPEDSRAEFRARLSATAASQGPQQWEMKLAPRGAEPLWVEVRVARFAPQGAHAGLHWTIRDITARRTSEGARGDAADTLRIAAQSIPMPWVVLDVDGTVLLWSAAAERLTGWKEDEVVGRPLPGPDGAAETAAEAAAGSRPGQPAGVDLPLRTRAGENLELAGSVVALAGENGVSRGTLVMFAAPEAEDERPAAPTRAADWTENEARRVLLGGAHGGELVEGIRQGIASGLYLGRLHPGDRLPSIREVARHTAQDHRYVSAAYRRLASEGVVDIRTRHGVIVGAGAPAAEPLSNETAEWLAGVIGEAAAMQVKAPQLPDLVRRWTGSAAVRCLCVDGTEDDVVALTTELQGQWGFRTERLIADENLRRDTLVRALREADVVVTTPFHAALLDGPAQVPGVPVVVLQANPDTVRAAEERLRYGGLTAVVMDPRYGERLRCMAGGERLHVVLADDEAALAALDPAEPVLMTRAAHARVRRPLRLLAPLSPAFSPARARDLAAVLIRRNLEGLRTGT